MWTNIDNYTFDRGVTLLYILMTRQLDITRMPRSVKPVPAACGIHRVDCGTLHAEGDWQVKAWLPTN